MNGNDKGSRISLLARIKRRSKEEILKEDLKREVILENHAGVLAAGAEVFTRVPNFMYNAHSTALREDSIPISSVLAVGGLARKTIGHMNGWRFLKENISKAEGDKEIEDEIHKIRYLATRGYDDMDGYATFNVELSEDKNIFGAFYKGKLQQHIPESLRKFFEWEFHGDCLETDEEFKKLVDDYRNRTLPSLRQHEQEILLPLDDPDKSGPDGILVVPVVLYVKADSKIKPILQQLIDNGNVRTMETYFKETFLPWAKDYMTTFPETAKGILSNVVAEVKSDGLTEEDTKKCLEVYSRIGDISADNTNTFIKNPMEIIYKLD